MTSRGRDREPDESARRDNPESDPAEVARAIALRQLTLGPRSRAQLAQALARRGVPDDIAVAVLDRLEAVGLVDDAEFARMLVRTRHGERGLSRRALRHELRRTGVADDDGVPALEQVSAADEEQAARRLVQRRLPSLAGVTPEARLRRLVAMLGRRGYGPGLAYAVVRSEIEASGATLDSMSSEVDPSDDSD